MNISINLDNLSDDELYRIYTHLKLKFDIVERKQVLTMDLQDLRVLKEVDTRVIHLLKSRRINTLQDLAACQRSTLEKINGMGPRGLQQIDRLLHKCGLELAKE
jgi:DNA-directed RNA polymerase alpha subunit